MASIQGYNVGTDLSFIISDTDGDTFADSSLGYLDDFETQATDAMLKIVPITTGGKPIHQTLWSGGTGRMTLTRFGPSFQQMFMDLQNEYFFSGHIPQFFIQVNVRNRDGSVDQYFYDGVQFTQPRFGNFRSTREVSLQCGFAWSSCQGTGVLTPFLGALAALAA